MKRGELKKALGVALILAGSAMTLAGLGVWGYTTVSTPDVKDVANRLTNQCVNALQAQSWIVQRSGDFLNVLPGEETATLNAVAQLSGVQSACPAHELSLLCAGNQCDNGFEARFALHQNFVN